MRIEIGSVWKFVGEGKGYNYMHLITDVKDGIITTWSEPHGESGFSWEGPQRDFLRNFVQM